jgi:gamma-glutamylcyclotransferase (GGCT)/AIG2-like uncharacterized protein YtfP
MSEEEEILPLFVYADWLAVTGTDGLVAGLQRRPARARGHLHRLPSGAPALAPAPDAWVSGAVIDPPGARRLALLDRLAGVGDGGYRRAELRVWTDRGPESAWAYVIDAPRAAGAGAARP